ncbi:hypothetical protein [Ensifer adhaerens]|uniref:hypothetical protein n=1 Tax=Ensifer adhaerens TaxID=106592 RepID=UPI001F378A1B|nr:hypothetical protein [Ensifer adhaerens]
MLAGTVLIIQILTDMARDPVTPTWPVLYLLGTSAALGHLAPIARAMGLITSQASSSGRSSRTPTSCAPPMVADRKLSCRMPPSFRSLASVTSKPPSGLHARQDPRAIHHPVLERGQKHIIDNISAHDLINADEIMRLPEDRLILLSQRQRQAFDQELRYCADPRFNGAFDPA